MRYYLQAAAIIQVIGLTAFATSQTASKELETAELKAVKSVKGRLVFLGDSLTAGYGVHDDQAYPAHLEQKLKAAGFTQLTLVNASDSGSSAASGLGRLRWQLKDKKTPLTHLVLALGANDGLGGTPVTATKKDLAATITLAHQHQVKVLLMGMLLPMNYGEEYRKPFAAMFQELVATYQMDFVPFLLAGVVAKTQTPRAIKKLLIVFGQLSSPL